MNCQIEQPQRCPNNLQRWMPSTYQPYPMNFNQAPSNQHQILVKYQGQPFLQGLSPNTGPYLYQSKIQSKHQSQPHGEDTCVINKQHTPKSSAIMYPTTHSIPGPYLQSYINIPHGRSYPY